MASFLRRFIPRRPPPPPEHVRWVLPDGTEVPLDCAYLGTQKRPGQRWPWKRQHCWGITHILDVDLHDPDVGEPAVTRIPANTVIFGRIRHVSPTDRGFKLTQGDFMLINADEPAPSR